MYNYPNPVWIWILIYITRLHYYDEIKLNKNSVLFLKHGDPPKFYQLNLRTAMAPFDRGCQWRSDTVTAVVTAMAIHDFTIMVLLLS